MYSILDINLDDMAIIHLVMPKLFKMNRRRLCISTALIRPVVLPRRRYRANDACNGYDILNGTS